MNAPTAVDYQTIEGTAKGGSVDYDTLADAIQFAANETATVVQVYVRSTSSPSPTSISTLSFPMRSAGGSGPAT